MQDMKVSLGDVKEEMVEPETKKEMGAAASPGTSPNCKKCLQADLEASQLLTQLDDDGYEPGSPFAPGAGDALDAAPRIVINAGSRNIALGFLERHVTKP